ncbi:MAG: hypothetical protein R6W82_00365 [bacterium]
MKPTDRSERAKLSSTIRHCPLCGYDFTEDEHGGCPSCPVNQYCNVLCCPNCGYEFVEESWVVRKFRDIKSLLTTSSGDEEEAAGDA